MANAFDQFDSAAPAAGANPFDQFDAPQQAPDTSFANKATRFALGATEPAIGLAQLAAHATGYGKESADAAANWEEKKYQDTRKAAGFKPDDWDYWGGAGNVASPVNLLPGGLVGRAAGEGATLLGLAGRGAAAGAGFGAMQPVTDTSDYWQKKGSQAATGAITGGIVGPATGIASKIVAPNVTKTAAQLAAEGVSPEEIKRIGQVQLLARNNTSMTPGQILGGSAERVENALGTMPIIGTPIRGATQRGVEDFNVAAGNRALAPIGEQVDQGIAPGHDLFNHVEQKLSNRFDAIHARMSASPDQPFANDMQQIIQDAQTLPKAQQDQLEAIIRSQIDHKFTSNGGTIDGKTIQGINSELKSFIRARRADPSADTRALAFHVDDLRDAFDAMLERQNPAEAQPLRDTNLGWAHLVRLEKATANTAAGANAGAFTGSQLLSAEGQAAGKRTMARGNGLYQDIGEAAKSILPAKMQSSGTAERAATLGLIGGGLTISPHAALAAALLPALYSRTGQRLTQAALMNRPASAQNAARILRQYAPVNTRAALAAQGNTDAYNP